ncbi:MAG: hypothetical protein LBF04_03015 [Prevotellaceae bacterium]|jgi:hypothetical protein|nr:hypothetical protein [Prevotellaceae bacterium]
MKKAILLIGCLSLLAACSGPANKLTPFAEPQEYVGNVSFEDSENVEVRFTLSADVKQITELKLTADKLVLTPENTGDRQDEKQVEKEITFTFLENATLRKNIAIVKDERTGYNVAQTDSSGNSVIGSIVLAGGIKSNDTIELSDGKISLPSAPLIFDLTVTNACIYGEIKFEFQGCGTKPVYTVFKNTTTPQEIPENILEPENK